MIDTIIECYLAHSPPPPKKTRSTESPVLMHCRLEGRAGPLIRVHTTNEHKACYYSRIMLYYANALLLFPHNYLKPSCHNAPSTKFHVTLFFSEAPPSPPPTPPGLRDRDLSSLCYTFMASENVTRHTQLLQLLEGRLVNMW